MNWTNNQPLSEETTYRVWISAKIVNLVLGVIMVYIFISHTIFCVKKHKEKASKSQSKGATKVNILIGSGLLAACLRILVDIEWFATGGNKANEFICNSTHVFDIVTYIYAVGSVYFFMWYRQKQIYGHWALQSVKYKYTDVASWTLLVCASALSLFSLVMFIMGKQLPSDPVGCYTYETDTPIYKYRLPLTALFSSVTQLALLWLVLSPLYRHRKKNKKTIRNAEFSIDIMRKLAVIAIICVVTDIAIGTLCYFLRHIYHLSTAIYNVNLVINMICIVVACKNWKERLFPLSKRTTKTETNSPVS